MKQYKKRDGDTWLRVPKAERYLVRTEMKTKQQQKDKALEDYFSAHALIYEAYKKEMKPKFHAYVKADKLLWEAYQKRLREIEGEEKLEANTKDCGCDYPQCKH